MRLRTDRGLGTTRRSSSSPRPRRLLRIILIRSAGAPQNLPDRAVGASSGFLGTACHGIAIFVTITAASITSRTRSYPIGRQAFFVRFLGLLPIEWVMFRNLDVIPVLDDNTLANRWSLLSAAPRRRRVRAPIGLIREPRLTN